MNLIFLNFLSAVGMLCLLHIGYNYISLFVNHTVLKKPIPLNIDQIEIKYLREEMVRIVSDYVTQRAHDLDTIKQLQNDQQQILLKLLSNKNIN